MGKRSSAGVQRTKGVFAPLAKSHKNSNKYAYFVLKSLGVELKKPIIDGKEKAPLYRDDNYEVLVRESSKLRRECGFDKPAPAVDGEDNKDRQMWVALLNQALAKHHGQEIKCWAK